MSGPLGKPTPALIGNRPGLSAISARTGTHSLFYESLTRGLADANRPGLADLRTRGKGDVTLGLLDAWAAVCDTLTFYGERVANEAYLRTATERQSLRAHARMIGYELAAAKAASVHLAFEAEKNDAPEETLSYDAGLQVRSIPRDGEVPQIFETIEPLTARAGWNAMRPRMSFPQILTGETDTVRLAASGPGVSPGDPVLFLKGKVPQKFEDASKAGFLRTVNTVTKLDGGEKRIELSATPTGTFPYVYIPYTSVMSWSLGTTLSTTALSATVPQASWSVSAISTAASLNQVSYQLLSAAIMALPQVSTDPILPARMQVKAGCFGNIAITQPSPLIDDIVAGFAPAATQAAAPGRITDTQSHVGDTAPPANRVYVYLDREYPDIVAGQHVLVRDAFNEGHSEVHAVETLSVEAYGLSAKVTRLELNATLTSPSGTVPASSFLTRKTTVYAAPQTLPIADLPITSDVGASAGDLGADEVELATAELALFPGKTIALSGERADLAGIHASEILTLADNRLNGGFSVLKFTQPPAHSYRRETVTLNANVAEATHGETVSEILGDGDATKPFAAYKLKSKPLTHVSARTASGLAPSLEVRVDGVLWTRVDDFRDAGPDDRVYVLRTEEDGTSRILFGDGAKGQRPPTGQDNVAAVYRKGAGSDGMLEAGQLSLLATKPAGLKSVVNPLAPAAGADAETLEDARRNAPLQVLTLGRVVSLRDYEDFARGFAAIAKAKADWTFDGFQRPIFVTVAGQEGVLLPEDGEDMVNLHAALRDAGEPDIRVSVRNYVPASFVVEARLFPDPAYRSEDVEAAAWSSLEAAFSFDARDLGQGVSRAQVISVLQAVDGVLGVDLDHLYRTGASATLEVRLGSAAAGPALDGTVPKAAELLTIDIASSKLEVVT